MRREPPSVPDFCDFLRARIAEERWATEGAALAPDGDHAHPWEFTEPGTQLGVRAAGAPLAAVSTGRGPWADHVVALHMVRTQPLHTLVELDALAELVDLLDHCDNHDRPMTGPLLAVVMKFAARYRDHPDHPEHGRS